MRGPAPIFLLGLAVLAGPGCTAQLAKRTDTGGGPHPSAETTGHFELRRHQAITPPDWPQALRADLYRPAGEGPFPAVLLIHGGAWKRGSPDQVEHLARRIAARGYLVVNTSYRFAPRYRWPAQLIDVRQALRWMRSAEGLAAGIDPARIGAFGYSAGAQLAALLGGAANDPGPIGDPQTAVRAVVAGGTPTDLTKFEGGRLIPNFIGGPREERLADYLAASPVSYVDAADPPVFLYHGSLDDLVPLHHATDYRALLARAGVPCELWTVRGHGHFSTFFADGAAVAAALDFLDRHLR